ncbi:CTD kinase subunit gamma CTK3-domain-containing protein [Lipomyces japonicus]|uniref:CTD kinase subunit gamma CTK3-domain-containing protein n=1 Tax=Lipomyces japonicus TaxID=56871 RepID=UPI0034CEF581
MPLDAFAARLTFTDLLRRLNASIQSATKCAQFALRYQDLSEDLYSCIIEELDKTSLNARINMLFFLETLCEYSTRSGFTEYVDMVRRDLWEIFDKVVPEAKGALANVNLARKVLNTLKSKSIIDDSKLAELETLLKEREVLVSRVEFQPKQEVPSFSREEILKRMDEDRERHKRTRENIWVIPAGDVIQTEFEDAWEKTSDLAQDDYEDIKEEIEVFKQAAK